MKDSKEEKLKRLLATLRENAKYVKQQNGTSICKNCGIDCKGVAKNIEDLFLNN